MKGERTQLHGNDRKLGRKTLEDIYNNVKAALTDDYYVEARTSAIRSRARIRS